MDEELSELVDDAAVSEEFQAWLEIQSLFHDYSYRNTLLIKQQSPEATQVADYRTWQEQFDRYVKEDKRSIWIRVLIITERCPECENSPSYHENSDCEYDETPPDEWSKRLVGFKSASVFDVSQTDDEPLLELDTVTTGEDEALVSALFEAADDLDLVVRIVDPDIWEHGDAKGVCTIRNPMSMRPLVDVLDRPNGADLATTLFTNTHTPGSTSMSTCPLSG